MSGKTSKIDLTEKALTTNGCNLSDFAEPEWNIHTLEKNIALLEKDIEELRHKAFGSGFRRKDVLISTGKTITTESFVCSGLDYDLLQSNLTRLDSMKERLKSLKLLNE